METPTVTVWSTAITVPRTTTSTTLTATDLDTAHSQALTVAVNPSTTTIRITQSRAFVTTFTAQDTQFLSILPTLPTQTLPVLPATTFAFSPAQTIQPTQTQTYTHVDASYFYADFAGVVTSTFTTAFLFGPAPTIPLNPTSNDDDGGSGFDSWSAGAKAGLIVGVICAALILLWLLICCYKRNAAWVAHDWRWAGAVEGGAPGMANPNMAYAGAAMSPVSVMSTPSYGYANPMYMRGGAEKKKKKGTFGRLRNALFFGGKSAADGPV